ATSLAAPPPLAALPPLALASARAAFLAAASASCSGVSVGLPPLAAPPPFSPFSFSSAMFVVPQLSVLCSRRLASRAALDADPALLLTFVVLMAGPARGRALAAPERDVRSLHRAFLLQDAAARVALRGLGVALDHVDALDHHAALVGEQAQHAPALALLL